MADWGDSILLTVSEIRAIGVYSTPPGVTGLSYTDSDYSHVLHAGGSLSFTVDEDSAKTHGHDSTDLTIIQRVPPINQTTCDAHAEVDFDGLNFEHAGSVGIYGPEPALGNADWVGAGGATSPNLAGEFTVSGAGATLTLTLPCNYGALLDDVPSQNFPTGMPGLPTIAYFHRADVWRDYDGENDQQDPPQPYSIPAEARYCWRGFATLTIPITGCEGLQLTMEIAVRRHSVTDTHLSDSTRQEDCTHSYSDTTLTYISRVGSASEVVFDLALPGEETDPDLEQVMSVVLAGFPMGNLTIDEPALGPDPTASRIVVKVFEGREYEEGGFSAIVSPTYGYALIDCDEDNGGHDTQDELTVRMWDYVETAYTYLDVTTAFSLAAMAGILHNVCDAWNCSVNQDALDAATLDDEDNRLTTCWGFDVCHPDCELTGDDRDERPLLQAIDEHLNTSIRCRNWTIVPGIVNAIRTDLVIGGAAHGLSRSGGNLVRNVPDALTVWRNRSGGSEAEWTDYDPALDIDAYGMWHSNNLPEFNPADDLRWQYGVSSASALGPTASLGSAYLREYVAHGWATTTGHPQDICQDEHDRTWGLLYDTAGAVVCKGADMGRVQPIWEDATAPFGTATTYDRPRITCGPRGRLIAAATDTTAGNQMVIAVSDDMGSTWQAIAGSVLTDMQYGDVAIGEHDELAVCGWHDDAIWFRLTTQTDHTADDLTATETELQVCAAVVGEQDTVPWSIVERVTRGIWAVLVEGAGLYVVQCYGVGFAEVTGTHIADGLQYVDLAISEQDELGCVGYDAGSQDVLFRATTAADWTADPLNGAVTELVVADASTAEDGPFCSLATVGRGAWVAGVDDGTGELQYYRLRSPQVGFEECSA